MKFHIKSTTPQGILEPISFTPRQVRCLMCMLNNQNDLELNSNNFFRKRELLLKCLPSINSENDSLFDYAMEKTSNYEKGVNRKNSVLLLVPEIDPKCDK